MGVRLRILFRTSQNRIPFTQAVPPSTGPPNTSPMTGRLAGAIGRSYLLALHISPLVKGANQRMRLCKC